MRAQLPGIAIRLDHFWLAGHVFVVVVPYVPLTDKRLKIASVADAVGRVHVNHLNLAAKVLVVK